MITEILKEKEMAKSSGTEKSVLLVDDHAMIRQGLEALLKPEKDLAVCGRAASAPEALQAMGKLNPDLTIVDIGLGKGNGLELVEMAKARYPDLKILVYSMNDEVMYAERALRAGARGYLMKNESSSMLLEAIRKILKGEIFTSPRMTNRIMQKLVRDRNSTEPPATSLSALTNRELEVFQLLGQGKTTREVAATLNLSIKTIETYREHLKKKLNLRNATELVHYAVKMADKMAR